MAKTVKTTTPTPTPTPGKGPGVIAELVDLLCNGGGTPKELYEKLAERYPERATEKAGMRVTISVQLKKLHRSGKLAITSQQVEGRGTVYSAKPPTVG
jgi:hypothetical protein